MPKNSDNREMFWREFKSRRVIQMITFYGKIVFIILQFVEMVHKPLQVPGSTYQAEYESVRN